MSVKKNLLILLIIFFNKSLGFLPKNIINLCEINEKIIKILSEKLNIENKYNLEDYSITFLNLKDYLNLFQKKLEKKLKITLEMSNLFSSEEKRFNSFFKDFLYNDFKDFMKERELFLKSL